MRSKNLLQFATLVVLALGLVVSGCSKKAPETVQQEVGAEEGAGVSESLDTMDTGIMEGRTSGPMVPVYFEFDSSEIVGEQVQRIQTNADFLNGNPGVQVRIEGNCDPRGTQEYNLALGERRAQSAKSYLTRLGVGAERLSTISFGEEKLLIFGHDEISYAQNRRDDFVIIK
ncbi:OmpA family protein [Desulfobulbus oligotrophicus]|jgi:peptidoglycan-associated lipoprotein|uniref:Peptidoglycan-associated lipoprotein n=1 Tax=Desulfobulbus oligotrophicus TaxID=1909699 RepID=A0A7T5VD19_9BACT|nr:OmpA family protein [Desulfobulbus oligotrophicus]MDY0391521.1 OmpA family protein [Desulfobulbus oligotrophicus]QQG65566.1 OmpA family protein [Desulfobulbus oligotrophicus]